MIPVPIDTPDSNNARIRGREADELIAWLVAYRCNDDYIRPCGGFDGSL